MRLLYLLILILRFRSKTFEDIELLALVLFILNTANFQPYENKSQERFTFYGVDCFVLVVW